MQTHQQPFRRLPSGAFLFPALSPLPFTHSLYFPYAPNNYNHNHNTPHSLCCSAHKSSPWLAHLSDHLAAAQPAVGPIGLRPSISSLLAADDSGALQTAASVLLTGALALFLFRSLRRRAKHAKQMRFRATGANENLNMTSKPSGKKTKALPSPDEALLGAVIAAMFGVLLYKFTTTIEFSLNNQKLSNNYSVRQITITIRTIINGLCYLATFVFGFNSLGLFLYSGQLAPNSLVEEGPSGREVKVPLNTSRMKDMNNSDTTESGEEQTSDKTVEHKNEEYK
ncbi:Unknown protein [Striga hermonthica]|uniref:Uncharacterized protein n=1 Tax=Striga hermonthica TaxID=68872 RepID=A0A9N7MWU5_STRHE|nr:Unknown protein [Striga hermonthica]